MSITQGGINLAKRSRSYWYRDGYESGKQAAKDNLSNAEARKDLERAFCEDEIGEFSSDIRSHQVQMEGDISYDVGSEVTENQYEKWTDGFHDGFEDQTKKKMKEEKVDCLV